MIVKKKSRIMLMSFVRKLAHRSIPFLHTHFSFWLSSTFSAFYIFHDVRTASIYVFSGTRTARKYVSIYTDDSRKDEGTFRQSCRPIFLSLRFRSALERLAHFLALRRFVYFLYIRRGFRSATFTLPCQAAVEVFCNPGKDVPREKIDFTHWRACSVMP